MRVRINRNKLQQIKRRLCSKWTFLLLLTFFVVKITLLTQRGDGDAVSAAFISDDLTATEDVATSSTTSSSSTAKVTHHSVTEPFASPLSVGETSTTSESTTSSTTSTTSTTTTESSPTTPKLTVPPYLSPDLLSLKAPGPDTFCPRFLSGVGFTERITFLEVSGEKCLFPRSVCGIESTARANPDMQIYVYFNTNQKMKPQKQYNVKKPGKIRSCYVTEVLKQFANVHFVFDDLMSYIKESRFANLFEKGSFNESSWSYVHFSDALRLVLLQRYGGFYLDSDIVTFRPLHCLRNSASYINEAPNIENGIIVFDKQHPFLNFLMKYLVQSYKPDERMSIGPPKLGAAFQLFCGLKLRSKLSTGVFKCHNNTEITLLDPDSFFPVKHYEMYTFFTETFGYFDHHILLRRSFLTHVYGAGWGKPAPLTSLYASLARQYCPSTWNATHEANIEFGF